MALTKIESAGLAKPVDLVETEKMRFGDDADLQIWHQGNSNILGSSGVMYLHNTGASATDLDVRAQNDILLKPQNGAQGIKIIGEGAVELYNDGVKKFETTDTGVKIQSGLLEIAHTSCHVDFMETSTTNHRLRNGSGNFHIQRISDDKNTTTTQFLVDGGTGAVELYHNGTKKCETASNGLKMASGQGIDFSAYATSGNPSSNLLDDYEEGTATFSLQINGGDWSGVSYSYNTAPYIKIGKLVFCQISMFATNLDSTSGPIAIAGLPFTDGGGGGYREPSFLAGNHPGGTLPAVIFGAVHGNGTKISLRKAGSSSLNGNDLGGTFWMHGSVTYTST
tara:strand:- start:570 stop:1580 length:1011 start_codon:yes stop_codon:yes gene_type:complete